MISRAPSRGVRSRVDGPAAVARDLGQDRRAPAGSAAASTVRTLDASSVIRCSCSRVTADEKGRAVQASTLRSWRSCCAATPRSRAGTRGAGPAPRPRTVTAIRLVSSSGEATTASFASSSRSDSGQVADEVDVDGEGQSRHGRRDPIRPRATSTVGTPARLSSRARPTAHGSALTSSRPCGAGRWTLQQAHGSRDGPEPVDQRQHDDDGEGDRHEDLAGLADLAAGGASRRPRSMRR